MFKAQDMANHYAEHYHPSGVGPTGVPNNAALTVTKLSSKAFNG